MANRNRPVQVKFRVTPEERALIDKRMEQAGTLNMAAYPCLLKYMPCVKRLTCFSCQML